MPPSTDEGRALPVGVQAEGQPRSLRGSSSMRRGGWALGWHL